MTGTFGFMIELLVVGLLLVTIGYCAVLDRRLRAVRQDEQMMRKTVVDLSAATERAERAIESLRHTLGDCDRTLAERLRVAERYTTDLEDQIRSGDDVLARISRIVSTTQDPPVQEAPSHNYRAQPTLNQHAPVLTPTNPAPRPVAVPNPVPTPAPSRLSQTLAAARNLAAQASLRAQEPRQPQNNQHSAPGHSPYGASQRDYVA